MKIKTLRDLKNFLNLQSDEILDMAPIVMPDERPNEIITHASLLSDDYIQTEEGWEFRGDCIEWAKESEDKKYSGMDIDTLQNIEAVMKKGTPHFDTVIYNPCTT